MRIDIQYYADRVAKISSGSVKDKLITLVDGMVLAIGTGHIHTAVWKFWFWAGPQQEMDQGWLQRSQESL